MSWRGEESSRLSRPSVIRSVLNPDIPLCEGDLPRPVVDRRPPPDYEDPDLLDVLGHCFTDPLFQSLLRFPDGTELNPAQLDEVLSCGQSEVIPAGSAVKMLREPWPGRQTGLGWAGPEMCLTTEEKHRLTELFDKQVSACRDCMPVR